MRVMRSEWELALAWMATLFLSSLPWLLRYRPQLVPIVAAAALLMEAPWRILGRHAALRAFLMGMAAAVFIGVASGWKVLGAWIVLGAVIAAAAFGLGRRTRPRPDVADVLMMVGWGGAFAVFPLALSQATGGWVAPLVLLLAARRLGTLAVLGRGARSDPPIPAAGENHGDIFIEGAVLAGRDRLRASLPLDLVIEPGESVSILCDDPEEAGFLAMTFAGRRAPVEGGILAGGRPVGDAPGTIAVIAPGEMFIPGDLNDNLAAMCTGPLSSGELAAVEEACALGEVRRQLEGRSIAADGAPLSLFHRMLVLAARVIPSHYRIVVVEDPQPWVNSIRGEIWRSAVVRASVGRTSVWVTPDRQLAVRADRQFLWSHGTLRPVEGRQG